jgi:hypothetical protein
MSKVERLYQRYGIMADVETPASGSEALPDIL